MNNQKNKSYIYSGILLFATIWFALPATAGFALPQLMASMAAIKTTEASFTEERHNQFLKKPMKLSGRLIYKAPGTLIKQTIKPLEETFIIDGPTLAVERVREGKKQHHEVILDDFPALAPIVLGLRSVLSGDLKTLEQHYLPELSGSQKDWVLVLKPRRRAFEEDDWLKDVVKSVTIKGSGTRVSRVEILEPSGDRSITKLKH
ncbi:MAG: outer membrane lipoprotein carrier protein LolA [Proteobacteria bacterium]|nr:outer membrane lipoprotein carrier protein LolA [Pseudomonadota bacterium]